MLDVEQPRFTQALRAEGIPTTLLNSGEALYLQEIFQRKQVFGTSHYPFDYAGRSLDDVDYSRGLCPVAEALTDPARSRSFLVPCNEGMTDDDALQLARWGCQIEEHYSRKHGRFCPMDIEWAKDGQTGEIYIVQARPETVQALKKRDVLETYHLDKRGKVLASGQSVGDKIGQGPVRVVADVHELGAFQPGEVLVIDRRERPPWRSSFHLQDSCPRELSREPK